MKSIDGVKFKGHVDQLVKGQLTGWVWNPDEPTQQVVVQIDSDLGESCLAVAHQFRADLKAEGIGSGHHGFAADLSAWALSEVTITVTIFNHPDVRLGESISPDLVSRIARSPWFSEYAASIFEATEIKNTQVEGAKTV